MLLKLTPIRWKGSRSPIYVGNLNLSNEPVWGVFLKPVVISPTLYVKFLDIGNCTFALKDWIDL